MSTPSSEQLKQAARRHFRSLRLKLPVQWKAPATQKSKEQFRRAFSDSDSNVPPLPPDTLFIPQTQNRLHVDAAEKISTAIGAFMDATCEAISDTWSQWQQNATMASITIIGPVASGGTVSGIPWKASLLALGPQSTDAETQYIQAIAQALSDAWISYQSSIHIPGLPWYPSFAAFPGPMAPSTPNVASPLLNCQQTTSALAMNRLSQAMEQALSDEKAQFHQPIFESLAAAVEEAFLIWQANTFLTNVLANGTVPTFAPPAIPAGPVIGQASMAAGGLV